MQKHGHHRDYSTIGTPDEIEEESQNVPVVASRRGTNPGFSERAERFRNVPWWDGLPRSAAGLHMRTTAAYNREERYGTLGQRPNRRRQ